MKNENNNGLNDISSELNGIEVLPSYLNDLIENELKNNQISKNGNLFLSDELSSEIAKHTKDSNSFTYKSVFLNKTILFVGYYKPNLIKIKESDTFLDNIPSEERKSLISHVYYALEVPKKELDINEFNQMQNDGLKEVDNKAYDDAKSIKRLLQILDRKSMNSQGYIFLTENERDELGEQFLLKTQKLSLEDYVLPINIACVKPEIEMEMEKRYKDYSFDAMKKYKDLNTIIYPMFPNQKIKGRQYKSGIQTNDKKLMPLYFWMIMMGICFVASICIIIWTFGFVVPSSASSGIYYDPNPPVDGALVIQSLFPNAWTFLSHIAASFTIFLFLFFFAWRPMKEMVEKRHNYIANQISSAELLNKEADIKLEYATRQELLSYTHSNEIMENAIRNINLKKEAAEKQAKAEADQIIQNAISDTQKIHNKMRDEINEEIANNSLSIAAELLKRNVSSEDNQHFVDDFIKNLESSK